MSRDGRDTWTAVDGYLAETLGGSDAVLDEALAASVRAGLPAIQVSAPQGKMLMIMARAMGARRILEIGTLGGYSTIWLARGLAGGVGAGGRVVTLECDAKHAEVARANFLRAGVERVVELRLGKALETLPLLERERKAGGEPFDLVFIDADKENCGPYFEWAVRLSRVGSLIIVDNVVRNGAVIDAESSDEGVRGVRRFNEMVRAERRVSATAIQTVGSKGYDGFAMAVVMED